MEIKNEPVEVGFGDTAVLEFSLTGVQHSIKQAIRSRANGLCELIDVEVRKAFSPGRIEAAIAKQVEIELENSMRYGDGATLVRQIVSKKVSEIIAKLSEESTPNEGI